MSNHAPAPPGRRSTYQTRVQKVTVRGEASTRLQAIITADQDAWLGEQVRVTGQSKSQIVRQLIAKAMENER